MVTGRFGWPEVPPQIGPATTKLAKRLLIGIRAAPLGIVTGSGAGDAAYVARSDPDVTSCPVKATRLTKALPPRRSSSKGT